MHPEVKRTRSYIPTTLYLRRARIYSWRTPRFLGTKLSQKFWLDRYYPERAPPVLAYVAMDALVPVVGVTAPRPLSDLPDLVREHGGLFLKPPDCGNGRGAVHLSFSRDGIELNGAPVAVDALLRIASEQWQGHLVSEVIRNSEWAGKFYDRTLNTMRILTGVCRDTRTPVILSAIFKIGRDGSYPTDNWHSGLGGLTVKIDRETGQLGKALIYEPGRGGGRRLLAAHPDTNVMIDGEIVPGWPAARQFMLDIVGQLPFQGLIGWDIALTPNGILIVEGNGTPGLDIHEAHESLLATIEQRRCLAGMNIHPRRPPWRTRLAGGATSGRAGHQVG